MRTYYTQLSMIDAKGDKLVWWWLCFCCALAMSFVFIGTSRYGIGLSPDSVSYLASARSFIAYGTLLDVFGNPFVAWPPLYPVVLSFASVLHIDILLWARILNIILVGGVVFFAGLFLLRELQSRFFKLIGIFAIATSIILMYIAVMAWTELLFIFFVVLFLKMMKNFCMTQRVRWLMAAASITALACLSRYAGILLILTGAVIILFYPSTQLRVALKTKIKNCLLHVTISVLPLTLWLARNYRVSSTLVGERASSPYSFFQQVNSLFNSATSWFVLGIVPLTIRIIIVGMLLAVLIVLSVKSRDYFHRINLSTRQYIMRPVAAFTVVYTVGILLLTVWSTGQTVDDRYLSPLFIPVICLLLVYGERAYWYIVANYKKYGADLITQVVIILFLLMLLPQTIAIVNPNFLSFSLGVALRGNSAVNRFLLSYPFVGTIFSNDPNMAYLLTNQYSQFSPLNQQSISEVNNQISSTYSYLLWCDQCWQRAYVRDEQWVAHNFVLTPIPLPPGDDIFGIKLYTISVKPSM